ncbi:hypothetical protein CTEN210_05252 [Chaetoceros tenuissimus]|uniref:monogalactosyldiacylglycerol synthase n=1 Tax=Chaetoceros tenuissimus TaxID=426638 RepID=A0AAD3CMQ6_9STRA|nr:hypothetical protein CTEN210_05252 [Chaetoceros tenuissimus]
MNYFLYKRSIFVTAIIILFSVSAIVAEILPRADTYTSPHKYALVQRGGSVIVQDESGMSSNSTLDSTASFELSTSNDSNDIDVTMEKKGLKVLFLSADTGGGHRASAESLAKQFLKYFPGTDYDLVDVWTPTGVYPYRTLVPSYKHLSAHPRRWKALYYISNTRIYEQMTNIHSTLTCKEKIRKHLESYDPDVVISVHPTMTYLPEKIVRQIGEKRGKKIPFFTVVTDFGSGHCTWFQGMVDRMYVASDRIKTLAKRRGAKLSDDDLVMSGLPIRDEFAIHAKNMNGRTTEHGKNYRRDMKASIGLDPEKKMILLMGGGEGVGSLGEIAENLYYELRRKGVDASICVVCGRNEQLREDIKTKNWDKMYEERKERRSKSGSLKKLKNILKRKSPNMKEISSGTRDGDVTVLGLGFVSNMADFMVAADVLVSKAGPGTIAEAASLGLPVMITSFLPGQEAGNVDIVLDGGFGAFQKNPIKIASILSDWLTNDSLIDEMSKKSEAAGNPNAAADIVKDIGKITLEIMNEKS